MPKQPPIDMPFPTGGLNRRFAYQRQPPYTTPSAMNVRPDGSIEGRLRGGSRPGLIKAFDERIGSDGHKIRLLDSVRAVEASGLAHWIDRFDGTLLNEAWLLPGVVEDDEHDFLLPEPDGEGYLVVGGDGIAGEAMGAVRTALPLDPEERYTVGMLIDTNRGVLQGTYSLYALMPEDVTFNAPVNRSPSSGLQVRVSIVDHNTSLFRMDVFGSEPVNIPEIEYNYDAGPTWFWMDVVPSETEEDEHECTAWWGSNWLGKLTVVGAAGHHVGFGLWVTGLGDQARIGEFSVAYKRTEETVVDEQRSVLVAIADGSLYRENAWGQMGPIPGDPPFTTNRLIYATDHLQKLFIADSGSLYSGTGRPGGSGGYIFGDAPDPPPDDILWDELDPPISPEYDRIVITDAGAADGTYAFFFRAEADELGIVGGLTDPPATLSWEIIRSPKVFDARDDTVVVWNLDAYQGDGSFLQRCKLIARYRDRIILSGDVDFPHLFYGSQQGNPYDYAWQPVDPNAGTAFIGQASDASTIGEHIKALMPSGDDYLIFGCQDSLWIMRGDLRQGGRIDPLDRHHGVIGAKAWCQVEGGAFVFLSRAGLYRIEPGAVTYPQSISENSIPRELLNIDGGANSVELAYDTFDKGVHISVTPLAGGTSAYYWFDWSTQGFWPASYTPEHRPYVLHEHLAAGGSGSAILMAGADGYIRRHRNGVETDDGVLNENESVLYGPIRLGDDYRDGHLSELIGVPAENSGDVAWEVLVGDTAEQAAKAEPMALGTWDSGLNATVRPRLRGHSFFVRLRRAGGKPWAMERMTAMRKTLGKQRVQ